MYEKQTMGFRSRRQRKSTSTAQSFLKISALSTANAASLPSRRSMAVSRHALHRSGRRDPRHRFEEGQSTGKEKI
jgi:hypothetical protein